MIFCRFLTVLQQKSGVYNHSDVCATLENTFFGEDSVYDLEKRNKFMKLRENGLSPNSGPVLGKWMHGALLKFHDNYRKGTNHQNLGDPNIKVHIIITMKFNT